MSSPVPVLAVTHLSHTTERGGAELALLRLLQRGDRGWAPSLALPVGDLGVFSSVADDVRVVQVGRAQGPGASSAGLKAAAGFAWELLKQAGGVRRSGLAKTSHVIHANSTRSAVYGALAVWGTKTPLVVHLRDRMEADAIGRFGHLAFTKIVMRRATGFISNSESTAEVVRSGARAGQFIEVIPSAIGMEKIDALSPERDGRLRIGMVARLDPWKGQHLLIEAFAQAGLDEHAELVFVGGPAFNHEEHETALRDLVSRHELRNVDFRGYRDDVQAAIDDLDICVQYSTRPEPLGQNVLQYLARGKVVVVADEGGPIEWVEDGVNGVVVPARSVDALADALSRLVSSRDERGRLRRGAISTSGLPTDSAIARAHAAAFARAARIDS